MSAVKWINANKLIDVIDGHYQYCNENHGESDCFYTLSLELMRNAEGLFHFAPEMPEEKGYYLVISKWTGYYSSEPYYEYGVSYFDHRKFTDLPLDYEVLVWAKLEDPKKVIFEEVSACQR